MSIINKDSLKDIIQNFNKSSVLVIGDFALDEMIYGGSHRISREAPVLILKHTQTRNLLGAASNAANNISTLNDGKVSALGVKGKDYYASILTETLEAAKINTSALLEDENRVTTTKTRISGTSTQSVTQQIIRIDRESNEPLSAEIEEKILEKIVAMIPHFDGILLSDYGIGMMTQKVIETTIATAQKYNKFIAVDAQEDLGRFKGATVITPNQPDAEKTVGFQITDRETLLKAGYSLLEKTNSKMVLLTRGGEGMVLFEANGNITSVPAFNKTEVFDVTGAGDTVVASVILALCAGASGTESMTLGNLAASIVVRHFGAATTSREELIETLENINLNKVQELSTSV
jgi:rfaE bifunctional protein kinase chain/domain